MNWFQRLEKKYSKYAIKNLMLYIIVLYGFGFIVQMFYPNVYYSLFALDFSRIFKGEVWRLFTFIMQPPSSSLIFIVFVLYFYYMIGTILENIWGAFKFNVYFFSGVLLNIIAALIIYLVWGISLPISTHYINLALFMAFAFEQPDMQVLLFFVIPIKIKWMAYIDGAVFAITVIAGYTCTFLPDGIVYGLLNAGFITQYVIINYANATAALVSMLNFIIFLILFKKSPKNMAQRNFEKAMRTARKAEEARKAAEGRKASFSESFYNANSEKTTWEDANTPPRRTNPYAIPKHRCSVCGRTELDDDRLTFRFCSKCNGTYEYCNEHLYTHIHVE